MKQFLKDLHPIRMVLLTFVIISMVFKPSPGTQMDFDSWSILQTLILPVLMPIMLMLLWLDAIITRIWSVQEGNSKRDHYRLLVKINLIMSLVFFLAWFPYFKYLTE